MLRGERTYCPRCKTALTLDQIIIRNNIPYCVTHNMILGYSKKVLKTGTVVVKNEYGTEVYQKGTGVNRVSTSNGVVKPAGGARLKDKIKALFGTKTSIPYDELVTLANGCYKNGKSAVEFWAKHGLVKKDGNNVTIE